MPAAPVIATATKRPPIGAAVAQAKPGTAVAVYNANAIRPTEMARIYSSGRHVVQKLTSWWLTSVSALLHDKE